MIESALKIIGCLLVGSIIVRFILRAIVSLTGIIFPVDGFLLQAIVLTIISAVFVLIFRWEWFWSFVPGGGLLLFIVVIEIIRQGILGKQPPMN